MNQSFLDKQSSSLLQVLMLLISLGLHGLFLMMPTPDESSSTPPKEEQKKEEQVKISQLLGSTKPPAPKPTPKAPANLPQLPPPASKPNPMPAPKPQQRQPIPSPASQPNPIPRVTPTPQATPTPQLTPTPTPTPQPTPQATPTPTPKPQPTPQATPTPTPEATPTPTPENNNVTNENLLSQVSGEEIGAIELLLSDPQLFLELQNLDADGNPIPISGINKFKWISLKKPDQVFEELVKPDLESQGFEVTTQGEYGGGIVYVVTKNGQVVQYLNLVATKDKTGTLIVVWNQAPPTSPVSSETMTATGTTDSTGEENPGTLGGADDANNLAFTNVGEQVSGTKIEIPELFFRDPSLFFLSWGDENEAQPKPEIINFSLRETIAPEQVFEEVKSDFETKGFEVTTQGEYGGGTVYKVQQGNSTVYINLVPQKAGVGTIVVIWKQDPNSSMQ
jgi:hypothetical protein